jgi:hypothetical protein
MADLPENQKTPLGIPKNENARKRPKQRVVHNPLLVSLRHVNGKQRHIHCVSVDVLENRIGVSFRDAQKETRYFTEWFDRKFWHLITGDEKKAYYQKREEFRKLQRDEAYRKRVAEREARDSRRLKRLGVSTAEELEALQRARRARRVEIAKEVNAKKTAPRITFEELPTPTLEPPSVEVPESADPNSDALTQEEEDMLNGSVRASSDQRVGNLDAELPGEYNAKLHMKKDKFPFGDPEKLKIFDALVTSEVVKQEALAKLQQRKNAMQTRQALERGQSVWTTD